MVVYWPEKQCKSSILCALSPDNFSSKRHIPFNSIHLKYGCVVCHLGLEMCPEMYALWKCDLLWSLVFWTPHTCFFIIHFWVARRLCGVLACSESPNTDALAAIHILCQILGIVGLFEFILLKLFPLTRCRLRRLRALQGPNSKTQGKMKLVEHSYYCLRHSGVYSKVLISSNVCKDGRLCVLKD